MDGSVCYVSSAASSSICIVLMSNFGELCVRTRASVDTSEKLDAIFTDLSNQFDSSGLSCGAEHSLIALATFGMKE
jgi:hypothetical protein